MDRYLKIAEYIAEGEYEKADELMRNIVIDTARVVYESESKRVDKIERSHRSDKSRDEEDLDNVDTIGGDKADGLIADVSTKEDENVNEEQEETTAKPQKFDKRAMGVVANAAKLVPAPKPVNTQFKDSNNLTPFPKTD